MYSKKITYVDYNGVERKETFYFNLSKAELLEMEMGTNGGYENFLKRIIETKDQAKLTQIFKEIILRSYGIKSDDGKRFIKNPMIVEEFTQTEAYSELFTELATNTESATAFINGIMPQALIAELNKEEVRKKLAEEGLEVPPTV